LDVLRTAADDERRLEALRRATSNRDGHADDSADHKRGRHALIADVAHELQRRGDDKQGGDGHARYRVVGCADHADHPTRDDREEEAEDDGQQRTDGATSYDRDKPRQQEAEHRCAQHPRKRRFAIHPAHFAGCAFAHPGCGLLEALDDRGQRLDE